MSYKIMMSAATGLLLSGIVMVIQKPELLDAPLFLLKVVLALLVIGLFFYCPAFSAKAGERARRFYRLVVTTGLITLLVLSKLFI